MKSSRRLMLLFLIVVATAMLVIASTIFSLKNGTEELKVVNIPTLILNPSDIRNPEIATKHGILGYVEMNFAPDAELPLGVKIYSSSSGKWLTVEVKRGESVNIPILFHFVSHFPEITEARIILDPKDPLGSDIEQFYEIEDEKGNVIGEGAISLRELVSYDPNGTVTIKAGQILNATMIIHVPEDFPNAGFPIRGFGMPFGIVGVRAELPIIDEVTKEPKWLPIISEVEGGTIYIRS